MEVVDIDQAKMHLKISSDHADDDIQLKLDLAHGIVAEYILGGRDTATDAGAWAEEIEGWDSDTAPKAVIAAVLIQLGELWRWRGDQAEGEMPRRDHGFLAPAVVSLLHRLRYPVSA